MTGAKPSLPDEDRGPPEDGNRDFANLVALAFVVALAIGAFWLFHELERHGEIQSCIASGRRNCTGDLVHPDAPEP